ncbi:MAG: ACT domain-containing protein [Clostridiales bacterium]|nr:ACT domain-containing protein [Candidatus Scatonaster coprocaballi]
MLVKQINVFLENQMGRLAEVTKTLGKANIDIRALFIADTTDYGMLRMILDKPDEALAVLQEAGFSVNITPVIAVAISDQPGTLDHALATLAETGVSLEYIYAYVGRSSSDAVVVIRVQDPDTVLAKFNEAGIRVLNPEEVYGI